MYKSKLQQLCHSESWELPEYSASKHGVDHNPRFTAKVRVNGLTFETPEHCTSTKDAQNQAAKLAFDHFTAASPPPQPPNRPSQSTDFSASITNFVSNPSTKVTLQPTIQGTLQTPFVNEAYSGVKIDEKPQVVSHNYKNLLQHYAQKRNIPLPVYSSECKGPPHDSRFKALVTIDGHIYESQEYFTTIREAEHAAAKVACASLSLNEFPEEDSGLYKNRLQELALKKGLGLPTYETVMSGPPHGPTFISTVEIGGKVFQGQEAKSKKQAEINAAKVACTGLQECRASPDPTILFPGFDIKEALKVSSSILQSVITTGDMPKDIKPKGYSITHVEQDQREKEADTDSLRHGCSSSSDIVYARLRDPFPSTSTSSFPKDGLPSPSPAMPSEVDTTIKSDATSLGSTTSFPKDGPCSLSPAMPSEGDIMIKPAATSLGYSTNSTMDIAVELPAAGSVMSTKKNEPSLPAGTSHIPCSKVQVYSRGSSMKIPDGATELPISDSKWVAYKIDSN